MTAPPPARQAPEFGKPPDSITIFGRRAVLEALGSDGVEVLRVLVARQTPGEFRDALHTACAGAGVPLEQTGLDAVAAVSGDPRNDQGVAARIRLRRVLELQAFIDSLKGAGAKTPAHVVALDGVTNPQNAGMIVRSAVAAGVRAVLWPTRGCPWVSGLVIKSSAGAAYRVPIVRCESSAQGIAALKQHGFRAAGLSASGATSLFDLTPSHRCVVAIGGETTGLSPGVVEQLDHTIFIPMRGGIESLNAAVAASLLCFELARKLPA